MPSPAVRPIPPRPAPVRPVPPRPVPPNPVRPVPRPVPSVEAKPDVAVPKPDGAVPNADAAVPNAVDAVPKAGLPNVDVPAPKPRPEGRTDAHNTSENNQIATALSFILELCADKRQRTIK